MRWKEGETWMEPLQGMYFDGPGLYDLTGTGKKYFRLYDTAKKPSLPAAIDPDLVTFIQIQEITIDGKYVPLSDGIVLSEGNKGFVDMHRTRERSFDENRDYFYPIPKGDIDL